MRLWRIYFRVGLGGLAVLILVTALTWVKGTDDYGILLLTEYWIVLCLIVGLLLLFARAAWRLAARFVKLS
jgi:hypothetical protein